MFVGIDCKIWKFGRWKTSGRRRATFVGQEQYLFHENYYSIVAKHNEVLDKERTEFESKKEQPLKNSMGFMVFTGIIAVLLIRVFIVSKNKK